MVNIIEAKQEIRELQQDVITAGRDASILFSAIGRATDNKGLKSFANEIRQITFLISAMRRSYDAYLAVRAASGDPTAWVGLAVSAAHAVSMVIEVASF